jgi:hypothetical protein
MSTYDPKRKALSVPIVDADTAASYRTTWLLSRQPTAKLPHK